MVLPLPGCVIGGGRGVVSLQLWKTGLFPVAAVAMVGGERGSTVAMFSEANEKNSAGIKETSYLKILSPINFAYFTTKFI